MCGAVALCDVPPIGALLNDIDIVFRLVFRRQGASQYNVCSCAIAEGDEGKEEVGGAGYGYTGEGRAAFSILPGLCSPHDTPINTCPFITLQTAV